VRKERLTDNYDTAVVDSRYRRRRGHNARVEGEREKNQFSLEVKQCRHRHHLAHLHAARRPAPPAAAAGGGGGAGCGRN